MLRRRDRISLVLLVLTIAIAIFAVGGAPRPTQGIVAFVAAAVLLAQLRSRRRFAALPPLLVLLVAASAFTAIQVIPLPTGLVHALTSLATYRDEGAALAGVSTWSTLSMDPSATLRSLVFLLTLTAVATVALRISTSERGRYAAVAAVAVFAGIAAIVSLLHELFGASSLYGLYEPHQATPPILGPLLNSNHLGCLMSIGVITSAGLAFYPKQRSFRRAQWAFCGIACLVVMLATLSRGAMIALAAGGVVLLGTLLAQKLQGLDTQSRRRNERFLSRTLPAGIVIACSLVIAVYVGAGSAMQQLENTSLQEINDPRSKFAAWRSSINLVEESPWVGTGRGAFEAPFTRIHPASALVTFTHLENEPLQVVVEWGLPAALLLVGLCGWLVLMAIRRWNDGPLAAAALGAIMVVAFQSNFDFGLQLLGIAVPSVVLFATLTYVPLAEVSPSHHKPVQVFRGLHAASVLLGAVLLFTPMTRTLDEDHRTLREDPSLEDIRASIAAHPLDYFGYAALSSHMITANDANAVRMLNHAMRLHPTHPGLHQVAARILVRSKRLDQAEIEYAAAIQGSRNPHALILETVTVLSAEQAARAIPVELDIDVTVRTLTQAKQDRVSMLWLERVFLARGGLHTAEALYNIAIEQKDLAMAERAARRRCAIVASAQCRLAIARALVGAGKHKEVVVELQDIDNWHGFKDDKVQAWLMLCDSHAALGAISDARYCLRRLEGSALVKPGDPEVQRRLDAMPVTPTAGAVAAPP